MGVYRDARKDFVWQKDFPALSATLNGSKKKSANTSKQLKELEAEKTEQENLQIIQLVRKHEYEAGRVRSFPAQRCAECCATATPYHKQEDVADET